MTIGIAIPNFQPYAHHMTRLLDNIAEQTFLPQQVAVAMSECLWKPEKDYPFDILVNDTEDIRGLPTNSNIALSMLSTDIVTIMHGDDLMHPQRNQFLLWAMSKPEVQALVHGFKYATEPDLTVLPEKFEELSMKLNYIDTIDPNKKYPVAGANPDVEFLNGHITFRRELFDRFQYNEDDEWFYDADSEFNARLVRNGIFLSYIPQPLVLYLHRNYKG